MLEKPAVLLVEDSKFFASMILRRIQEELDLEVDWKETYSDAAEAIDHSSNRYLVALLDLTLPDAPNGEIVEYATKKGIPSIIFTGGFDGRARKRFISWNIVDYILKDSSTCVDTLLDAIRRVELNRDISILVVDDSKPMRDAVTNLLKTQLYSVLVASNGVEALKILDKHPEIKMIVTDYDMPEMDGFELIRNVRKNHSKNELAIIGMSASDDPLLSAKLIKSGANDFMPKPFQVEEFHCRVGHSIEMLENIALIKDLSYKDPLTRLYNRRYFFENADLFIKQCVSEKSMYSMAMIDIDHFKNVNDTHGHDAGDEVLRQVASTVSKCFPEKAVACRFGGEEFCVLTSHHADEDVVARFDGLRRSLEATSIEVGDASVSITISTGVCTEPDSVESMLKTADRYLYKAKNSGRNKVVSS